MNRIIVCVKPVPDPHDWHKVTMDPKTQTLRREGISNIINPLDKHALELALQIRETHGGEVVLLSMAPPFAEKTLREGLAMGADRAVLLSDRVFAGSDTLATAKILAAGCEQIGEYDLIITGNLSIDGSTAQVCSQLGEYLNLPSVMHLSDLGWEGEQLILTQKIENGHARLRGTLPLILGVRKELNTPRYTSFAGILAAESKEIKTLSNDDLKVDENDIGLDGSPTKMAGMEIRRFERTKERLEGHVDEIVQQLVNKIYAYGIIK